MFVSVLGLRPVYISLLLSQPPGSSSNSQACSPETAELASVIRANKHHTFAISTRPANSFQTGPHFTAAWTRCGTKWRPRAWLGVCKRNNVCSPEDLDGYMGHCWLTLAYHRTISTELCASINTFLKGINEEKWCTGDFRNRTILFVALLTVCSTGWCTVKWCFYSRLLTSLCSTLLSKFPNNSNN